MPDFPAKTKLTVTDLGSGRKQIHIITDEDIIIDWLFLPAGLALTATLDEDASADLVDRLTRRR